MSFVRTSNLNVVPGSAEIASVIGSGNSLDIYAVKTFIESNSYEEKLLVVVGTPSAGEIQTTGVDAAGFHCLPAGTVISLPPTSSVLNPMYMVGSRVLWIEGMDRDVHWQENGSDGDIVSTITLLRDVYENETLVFRMYFTRGS